MTNTRHNLKLLFEPASIAIVGAAREENKIGHIVLRNSIESGFKGKIFPVNPKATEIDGLACYADYSLIPAIPDLAIIAVPSTVAMQTIEPIAKKGTKNIVIFSAGFKEIGESGAVLENQLKSLAEKYELNILGPNCLGFVNTAAELNATFGRVEKIRGNLRFVTQSGALATSIFDWATATGVGFNEFITLGNKARVGENEVLAYWLHNKNESKIKNDGASNYQPIGLYLESIEKGQEFLKLASEISQKDPIFLLKPGRSEAAKKAMQSHTGAMAGDDAILDVALKQAGVIRCDGVEDMFDLARAFAWENAPMGPNVAIVSNAGGPAVITTDILKQEGLNLAPINEKTRVLLSEKLPPAANLHNPIDVLGDALADRYQAALDAVLAEKEVDALIVILTPQIMTQIEATADVIGGMSQKYHKPILCAYMGGNLIEKGEHILSNYKIPSFRFPERAVKALAKMWWWQNWKQESTAQIKKSGAEKIAPVSPKILKFVQTIQQDNRSVLSSLEANEVLKLAGIKVPATALAATLVEAEEFTDTGGWPVVLKISSDALLHKTESGGVIADIQNTSELKQAFMNLEKKKKKFKNAVIQIQQQVERGIEVIVGIKRDPSFGPVMMFGAGGIYAELFDEHNLHLLPIDKQAAEKLVMQSKIYKILAGFRGSKPYALDALYEMMVRLANLAETMPRISEIEINPVIVTEKTAWAVDGRVLL